MTDTITLTREEAEQIERALYAVWDRLDPELVDRELWLIRGLLKEERKAA